MKVRIYQVEDMKERVDRMFMSYDAIIRNHGFIDSEIYRKVYDGEVDCKDLVSVYKMFLEGSPIGFTGRFLSMSDIIEVSGGGKVNDGFYYCDAKGFKSIDFTPPTDIETRNRKIKVVLVETGKLARIVEIDNDLRTMQDIVGGDISGSMPFEDEVAIIFHYENKYRKPPNRAVFDKDGMIKDIISGSFFICYAPVSGNDFESLPDTLAQKYEEMFRLPQKFILSDRGISAVPYKPKIKNRKKDERSI